MLSFIGVIYSNKKAFVYYFTVLGVLSAEGILFVLPSSCSITPPVGEGESLRQMVSGAQ